jgi:integrase/recombinase XerD
MKRDCAIRSLYATNGQRKYVNGEERSALAAALRSLPQAKRLFVQAFLWTGARISEVLTVTPESCQIDAAVLTLRTLKRRRFIVREMPVPRSFMQQLDKCFDLRTKQHDERLRCTPLWRFHRVTGWRLIKSIMARAGITGIRASPRGLRHSFGVTAIGKGLPLNLVQKLLGHASINTTTVYTDASGPEERAIVARLWSGLS